MVKNQGPLSYEPTKSNYKLNLEKFCQQLDNLMGADQENTPMMFNSKDIILRHDNTGSLFKFND
ncbi:hypothetical protein DICVIV_03329 [Dictyocaulus viviparus]|uniref:Uncharacterized protein n=1 Tax=Dictyocaulus viviparus TaxID=29172 RepID=A0A0D8Y384_DICVI|nr:hypothetical protein DICVIV_03329 [Dictyocaulus viviparus]